MCQHYLNHSLCFFCVAKNALSFCTLCGKLLGGNKRKKIRVEKRGSVRRERSMTNWQSFLIFKLMKSSNLFDIFPIDESSWSKFQVFNIQSDTHFHFKEQDVIVLWTIPFSMGSTPCWPVCLAMKPPPVNELVQWARWPTALPTGKHRGSEIWREEEGYFGRCQRSFKREEGRGSRNKWAEKRD